jgi:hypothetical protein
MSSDSFDRAATRLGTAKRHCVTMTTNERGLVIVTGVSSGIGDVIAVHLREGGFSVLAGVRRASVTYSSGTPAGEPL